MTRLTPERIAEIEAREQAATEGPWLPGRHTPETVWNENREIIAVHIKNKHNIPFIANARQDVPDLLNEVKRLQADNQKLREALEPFAACFSEYTKHNSKYDLAGCEVSGHQLGLAALAFVQTEPK